MPGTVLCASHMIFHFLPLNPRGMHSCPHFQMEKSRFRDVRELVQLVTVKLKIGIQVHLTLKPILFPPHWLKLNWLKLLVILSAKLGTDPSQTAPCCFFSINQWSLVLRSRILIVLSTILGTPPSFRPSLEAQNSRVAEEVYFKHFIWVSRISRTLPD